MTTTDYRAIKAWNWSSFKFLRREGGGSPKLFKHKLGQPDEDRELFKVGRLTHALVLERGHAEEAFIAPDGDARRAVARMESISGTPHDVLKDEDGLLVSMLRGEAERYYGIFEGTRAKNSAKYKAWMDANEGKRAVKAATWAEAERRAEYVRDCHGKTVITRTGYSQAHAMAEAVLTDFNAMQVLNTAHTEIALFWIDPTTGLECKGKLDGLNIAAEQVIDLKKVQSLDPRDMARLIHQMGYHIQLVHYGRGVERVFGFKPKRYTIVAVEASEPHDVAVFHLEQEAIDKAEEELDRIMVDLKTCLEDDHYPGQHTHPQRVSLPAYVFDVTDELTFGGE